MIKEPKILLIYPPNQLFPIETPRPDGSSGPLYLAGALEDAGFETDILDASVGTEEDDLQNTFYRVVKQPNGLIRFGMSSDRIREVIAGGGYNIVGISSNHTPQTRTTIELSGIAKSINQNILVMVGGVNSRNLPERLLNCGNIDLICLTEGEKIIVNIVKEWAGRGNFNRLSGVAYGGKGECNINPVMPSDICANLDELPYPAWHKLPFEKYDKIAFSHSVLTSVGVRYAHIMTSRGCPFRCSYCHNSMEKSKTSLSGNIGMLRLKSISRVLEEVAILKKLGVKKLYFEDDSLLAKKTRVKEIFAGVREMGFEIEDVNGVNLVHFWKRKKNGEVEIDVEYIEFLKNVGVKQLVFPVESGSQRILDTYATKKLDLAKFNVVELVRIFSRTGIRCPINIMMGFPDETEEEIMKSVELGEKLVHAGAPYCTFFIAIPFPGSSLYEMAIAKGYLDKNFDTDTMNFKTAIMKNTTVPPERIIELRDWAWEKINSKEYIDKRFTDSAGARWRSGAPK